MSTDLHRLELYPKNSETEIQRIIDGANVLSSERVAPESVPSLFDDAQSPPVLEPAVDYQSWAYHIETNPLTYVEAIAATGRGIIQNREHKADTESPFPTVDMHNGRKQHNFAKDAFSGFAQITPLGRDARLRDLMRRESQIGGKLFGVVPKGHSRHFFCLDERTWVWSERSDKADSMQQVLYEFQSRGVLKTVDGVAVGFTKAGELARVLEAIHLYQQQVSSEIYHSTPLTTQAA